MFTINKLIKKLRKFPDNAKIVIVDEEGTTYKAGEFGSYRGYYDDMYVEREEYDDQKTETVKEFRERLQLAIGQTFEGYKGGDYMMNKDTPVWFLHTVHLTTILTKFSVSNYQTMV